MKAKKPYDLVGAAASDRRLCLLAGPRPAGFFCFELVFEAYKKGGLRLTATPSECVTPGEAVNIATQRLVYIGHLLGNPSWFPRVAP